MNQQGTPVFMPISRLPKGELVKLNAASSVVYVKGDFNRSTKKYELQRYDDINQLTYKKGGTRVVVGFQY